MIFLLMNPKTLMSKLIHMTLKRKAIEYHRQSKIIILNMLLHNDFEIETKIVTYTEYVSTLNMMHDRLISKPS